MRKHLRIFLTTIVLTFSFCFITSVKADSVDLSKWEDISNFTLPNGINANDYSILIYRSVNSSINRIIITNKNYKFNFNTFNNPSFPYIGQGQGLNASDSGANSIGSTYYNETSANSKIFSSNGTSKLSYVDVNYIIYTNTNIYKCTSGSCSTWFNVANAPQPQAHTITFHLNGGWVYDPTDDWGVDEDFSFSLYQNEIEPFFSNLEVHKYMMIFQGWYYDSSFTRPFTINDTISSDVDLYAKYRYERVEDFLSNTTFNEHTYDTGYSYAIINRGDNGDSVYIGLPFEIYNLEVYEYIESEYRVKDGSSACPVPLYNKNGYFYYDVNTLFTNNQEVLILPRALFEALDPNNFEDPNDVYKFYLTDNAYISYTNDLSAAQIVDSNGETISINMQNSYELSQQYQELYSNPENIFNQMNIFLEKMKKTTGAIKEIFGYLFNSLNSTIKSFIMFIMVVILITTIISFSRRG